MCLMRPYNYKEVYYARLFSYEFEALREHIFLRKKLCFKLWICSSITVPVYGRIESANIPAVAQQ